MSPSLEKRAPNAVEIAVCTLRRIFGTKRPWVQIPPLGPEKEVKKDFWLKNQEISRLLRPLDTKIQGPQNLDLFPLQVHTDRT